MSSKVVRYYTGMTKRLKIRYQEHKNRKSKYTRRYNGCVHLEYVEMVEGRNKKDVFRRAHKLEKKYKKYSQKRKKKLIEINRERTNELIERYMV